MRARLRILAVVSVLALGALAAGVTPTLAGAPSNDNWAQAQSVGALPATIHGDTTDATTEPDDPSPCGLNASTVWYRFTPATNMAVLLDLKGSSIQADISVWRGSTLAGLHFVACGWFQGNGRAARMTFSAKAGTHYYVLIKAPSVGAFKLTVKRVTPPANDAFGSATSISAPYHASVSNIKATSQTNEPAAGNCIGLTSTRWYRIRLPHAATLRADTFGSDIDTVLAVYTGGPSIGSLHPVACNDDTSLGDVFVFQSSVAWLAKANKTYWIQVGAYGETGVISFSVKKVTSPANDSRGSATVIPDASSGVVTRTGSLRNATWQSGESVDSACPYYNNPHHNVYLQTLWYRFTTESADPLEIDATADAGVEPIVSVYSGASFGTQTLIDCAAAGGAGSLTMTFTPQNATTYWIQVAGEAGNSGPYELSLQFAPDPH
jgi:hypothetical protein